MNPTPALVAIALMTAACAGESGPPAPVTVVRDSAGITIVENSGTPEAPFQLSAEPVLRIGVVSGDLPYQFASITGLARLSDDRIVVLDGMSKELRFFSLDGEHLLSVGGEGFGPGEFRSGGALDVLPGDTLQVEDFPWRNRFAPDGTPLDRVRADWSRVKRLGDFFAECSAAPIFLGDGIIACTGSDPVPPPESAGLPAAARTLLRIPWDYSRADTLASVLHSGLDLVLHEGELVAAPEAFHLFGFSTFGGSPARLATGRTDRYAIELYDLDGTLRRIIRRTDGMRPPSTAELEPRPVQMTPPPGYDVRRLARAEFSSLTPVDSISPLRALFIDDLNRIWGRIVDPALVDGIWYDVFDADGTWLGHIRLPFYFQPFQIGVDFVLGVRKDEFDVEFVEMYDLIPASSGN